ncbi:MAG: hypothetical protein Q7J80_06975 [Anaerolineales bacterium]|nr:hypothetical protein [Anaerolineales bacterium]
MQKDDLLRLLRDPNLIPSEMQILLSNIAAQAAAVGMPCYLVGGSVRDLLLSRPVKDLDVVVEGDAIKLGTALVKKFGGRLTRHDKFRTAIWHLPETRNPSTSLRASLTPDTSTPDTLDLITARKETYGDPGALPIVTPASIEDDLRRRDFSLNAMAIRMDGDHFGELYDPLGGQNDLEQKLIRVLHPRSFIDDPTRIFRAIRYEQRYAFILHHSSFILINPESLAVLSKMSGERIRHELDLIFEEEKPSRTILRVGDLGILKSIHSALPPFSPNYAAFLDMNPIMDISASRTTMGYMLWLMDLVEDEILSIAKRLDFISDLTRSIIAVSQLKKSLPVLVNSKPSVWTFALEKFPPHSVYAVYLVTRENSLLDYLSIWRHIKSQTTGNDLIAKGLQPGPRFGEIFSQLRAAWLDGVVSSKEQEAELLHTML